MKDIDLVVTAKERGGKSRIVIGDNLPIDQRYAFWRELSSTDVSADYEFAQLWISGQPTKLRVFKQPKPDPSAPSTKPTMRSKLSVLAAAAMLFIAADASAQRYTYETILPANTATVAATSATNLNVIIDVTKQDTTTLQIETMASANGAYTLTFPIYRSVDRSNWDTMTPEVLAISFNGVTKQVICTNIPSHGAGYLKIPYATNATATIISTNLVLKRAIKIP